MQDFPGAKSVQYSVFHSVQSYIVQALIMFKQNLQEHFLFQAWCCLIEKKAINSHWSQVLLQDDAADAQWFDVSNVPQPLAFDHKLIVREAFEYLLKGSKAQGECQSPQHKHKPTHQLWFPSTLQFMMYLETFCSDIWHTRIHIQCNWKTVALHGEICIMTTSTASLERVADNVCSLDVMQAHSRSSLKQASRSCKAPGNLLKSKSFAIGSVLHAAWQSSNRIDPSVDIVNTHSCIYR